MLQIFAPLAVLLIGAIYLRLPALCKKYNQLRSELEALEPYQDLCEISDTDFHQLLPQVCIVTGPTSNCINPERGVSVELIKREDKSIQNLCKSIPLTLQGTCRLQKTLPHHQFQVKFFTKLFSLLIRQYFTIVVVM